MTFKGIISFGAAVTPTYLGEQSTFNDLLDAPIDGVVVNVMTDTGVQLSTDTLNVTRSFEMSDLSTSISALQTRNNRRDFHENLTRNNAFTTDPIYDYGKCKHNFAKLQFSGGGICDYFSESFSIVFNKLLLIGQYAAEVGMNVILDAEPYVTGLWVYNSMPLKASYTFVQYQSKCYDIGYALAQGWRGFSKTMSVMMIEVYDYYAQRGPPYEANEWGLYRYFLDGFLDGWGDFYEANGGSGKVILTQEGTFGELSATNIIRYGLGQINGAFDAASPPPDQNYWGSSDYFFDANVVEHGLSLWIDKPTFNPSTPDSNYWTPAVFASQLGVIMENCEWAWIYQDQYKFYNSALAVPQAYIDEIKTVRRAHGLLND